MGRIYRPWGQWVGRWAWVLHGGKGGIKRKK